MQEAHETREEREEQEEPGERLTDYDYDLPAGLIASEPAAQRSASRLLALARRRSGGSAIGHHRFFELPGLLRAEDLLVFNNTRVIRARLRGSKATGGKVEILIERIIAPQRALAQVRASKSPKPGDSLLLTGRAGASSGEQFRATVRGRSDDLFELHFDAEVLAVLESIGEVPLPPYIRRRPDSQDAERYQTVYAERDGAVAAPTAGLHFDRELLGRIAAMGVRSAFVTLHVGAGTFQPIRVERIREHRMHEEQIEVAEDACAAIARCRARGGRVIAVGTTVVRALETAAKAGQGAGLEEFCGATRIFIHPGFEFRAVDALITNFHLPCSSLLLLVSAFCGSRERLLAVYREAIAENYRFYSYGDAMFIAD